MGEQTEMRLVPVGVIASGPDKCAGCGFDLQDRAILCPACGRACRHGMSGLPYPRGTLHRYAWALDQSIVMAGPDGIPRPDPVGKLALIALVSHDIASSGNEGVFPSVERLCRITGLSKGGVEKALRRLEQAGWITRGEAGAEVKRRARGRRTSTRYEIRQAEAGPPCSCEEHGHAPVRSTKEQLEKKGG